MNLSSRLVVCFLFVFVFALAPSVLAKPRCLKGDQLLPKVPIVAITSGATATPGTCVGPRAEPCETSTAQLNQAVES